MKGERLSIRSAPVCDVCAASDLVDAESYHRMCDTPRHVASHTRHRKDTRS